MELFNPLSAEFIKNPFPVYKNLREASPVQWHEDIHAWLLLSYKDCERVLRDHKSFARDIRRVGYECPNSRLNVQTFDPPDLMDLRKIILMTSNKAKIDKVCEKVYDFLVREVRALPVQRSFNFVEEISYKVAMKLTHEVCGVSDISAEAYYPIFYGMTRSMDSRLDESRIADGQFAYDQFRVILDSWYKNANGECLTSQIKNSISDDLPHKKDLVMNTVGAIFNASFSSTEATMSSFLEVVLNHSEKFKDLPENFDYRNAAHEIIRFVSPAQGTARYAIEDCKIGETAIESGDMLITLLAAANRDPLVFEMPDNLILDRKFTKSHLGFGWGSHHCTGSDIAISWLTVYLKFLAQNVSLFKREGSSQYMHSATLRSLSSLPVSTTYSLGVQ